MAGPLQLASQRIQADLAGFTGGGKPTQHFPATASLSEMVSPVVSEMDQIVAGGLHPEHFLQPLSRALEAPAVNVGPHGGEIARIGSSNQPGPVGTAVARQITQMFNTVRGRLPQAPTWAVPQAGGAASSVPLSSFTVANNAQTGAPGIGTSGLEFGGGTP